MRKSWKTLYFVECIGTCKNILIVDCRNLGNILIIDSIGTWDNILIIVFVGEKYFNYDFVGTWENLLIIDFVVPGITF